MITNFILLILGLFLLLYSADQMINNADHIAKKFSISPLFIGLTIVAFGTSAPELIITILAALKEVPAYEAITGNVIGSNIANILLILGVSGVFFKIDVNLITKNDCFYLGLITAYFSMIFFVADIINIYYSLGFGLLVVLFFNYLRNFKKNTEEEFEQQFSNATYIKLLFSFIGLFVGGKLFLDYSLNIFTILGFEQTVIGITILAIGTSLPELATVILSYIKRKGAVGIGNIIGSNMMNILFVFFPGILIVQSRGYEFIASKFALPHIYILIIVTLIIILMAIFKMTLSKILSCIFILIYIIYIYWVLT